MMLRDSGRKTRRIEGAQRQLPIGITEMSYESGHSVNAYAVRINRKNLYIQKYFTLPRYGSWSAAYWAAYNHLKTLKP